MVTWVITDSANGLIPEDTKPKPEPMWGPVTIARDHFHQRYTSHQLLNLFSKFIISFNPPRGQWVKYLPRYIRIICSIKRMPAKLHIEDDLYLSSISIQREDEEHAKGQDGRQDTDRYNDGHFVVYAHKLRIRYQEHCLGSKSMV